MLALVRECTADEVVEEEGAIISPMLVGKARGDVIWWMFWWPPRSSDMNIRLA